VRPRQPSVNSQLGARGGSGSALRVRGKSERAPTPGAGWAGFREVLAAACARGAGPQRSRDDMLWNPETPKLNLL
jgi:hypothetical protein